MPLPIVTPTEIAIVCSRPTERGMRSPQASATVEPFIEELYPVAHGYGRGAAQVVQAADVRGRDHLGCTAPERLELGSEQALRQLRLQDGISAGRPAAALPVIDRRQRVPR